MSQILGYEGSGEWLALVLLAAALCYGGISLLLSEMRGFALDIPNHRSMHERPVPRTGGWALFGGSLIALLVSPVSLPALLLGGFALLVAVSITDDLRQVSISLRLPVHMAAVALVLAGLPQPLAWWWYPLLLGAGVWMVNLYNFMDGLDGLAGSMAAIGFSALGLICAWRGDVALAGACMLLVTGALVFLHFNWPPARIFLGDTGSTTLGLAVVAVSVFGWQRDVFDLWIPVIVFVPFWLDATYTLLRRMLSGQRWWEGHREHFYQRSALREGVARTLRWEILWMLSMSALALLLVAMDLG